MSRHKSKKGAAVTGWFADGGDYTYQHHRLGNSAWTWLLWVFTLEESAHFLRQHYPHDDSDGMPMSLAVSAMLFGYAVECALKGAWVRKGNHLIEGGKYKRIPGTADHNLVDLANAVGLSLTDRERNVLKRLSQFALFAGRYPVGKTPESLMPVVDTNLNKVDVGYFSKGDFRTTQSVLNRSIALISGKKRRGIGPPGSASYRRASLEQAALLRSQKWERMLKTRQGLHRNG